MDLLKRKVELVEKYYYPMFVETLENLQIKSIPAIQDVIKQLWQREIFSVYCLFGILLLVAMIERNRKQMISANFSIRRKLTRRRW